MTAPSPTTGGGLADTLNILLDKGLVIDASIRVSVIGIELLAIEARIVIASVDTYIRYLEAMQRLNATQNGTTPAISRGLAETTGLIPPPVQAIPSPVQASAVPVPPVEQHVHVGTEAP